MYTWTFWILAIWFVINVIWMWFALDKPGLQKTFAWINVIAVVWGFWVFYGAAPVAGHHIWFEMLNWVNVLLALLQFYFGYRHATKQAQ
ncbi:hypothetical protein NGP02_11305 [Lactiplantibacillus pentosus]|uniref:hypothetical protein n=1 Tax=Lactiplantibacillus pentosus TaxID=1589 RepID=UPI002090F4A4|nr:hypothetical protein [Lactiplantibacillus pentosus]WMB62423.1 hypothetical protein NGP02_11305 [Lactiplantibacillus pentosus]